MPLITVVGSLNLDVVLDVPRLPGAGDTAIASEPARTGPGGKGANQAAAAAAVLDPGAVAMVGRVGADDAGDAMRRDLADRGVDVAGVATDEARPTGRATVALDAERQNLILVDPGANASLTPGHVRVDAVRDATVLLAQLEVPTAAVLAAVRHARGFVVLNPAPVGDLGELLPHVDLLVPNRTELATLVSGVPAATPEEAADQVDRLASRLGYAGAVVVTLGEDGALVVADGTPTHVEAPAVPVVDTTGAGDVFCGVLAAGLALGRPVTEAAASAVRAAAASVSRAGAR